MIASKGGRPVIIALALATASAPGAGLRAEGPVLTMRAVVIGDRGAQAPLTIELFRWSSEPERAPLLAAMAAPVPPPSAPPPAAAGAGGRAGRGGRGGRGAVAPVSPATRLAAAVKAAPTIGFIWGHGVTGYSIKYAWHGPADRGADRIVLVTDRRLGANAADWAPPSGPLADAEFTVIEMRVEGTGAGEAKTSLTTNVIVDTAADTLALDGYAAATPLLKITR